MQEHANIRFFLRNLGLYPSLAFQNGSNVPRGIGRVDWLMQER